MKFPRLAGIGLAAVTLALACSAAPLFAYVATLATLGLAHVVTELRYVDQRFSARLGRTTLGAIVALLLVTVLLRAAAFVVPSQASSLGQVELFVVAMLAAVALAVGVRRGDPLSGAVGGAVVTAIAWGLAQAPSITLVVLAFLHNLTPVGFLAERLRGAARRKAMVVCAFVFGVVPALIGTGVVTALTRSLDWWRPDVAPLAVGPIDLHLPIFVPKPWIDGPFAIDLFAAAAYLQCIHYAVVLGVLPRLGAVDGGLVPSTLVRWPRGKTWARVVATASLLGCTAFVQTFVDARRLYGIASAVHAWSEVPVLILSLGTAIPLGRVPRRGSIAPA